VDIETIITELSKQKEVEYAHGPVQLVNCAEYPDDQYYTNGGEWYLDAINAPQAWGITKGSNSVKIALIEDQGVELNHPDLQLKIVGGDNNPGGIRGSHGTNVAGIAGAVTNNTIGIASLGWNIKLLTYQAYNDDDYMSITGQKIKDAADAGADVINLSFKTLKFDYTDCSILPKNIAGDSPLRQYYYYNYSYDFIRDAIDYAVAHNSVVVASAGNDNGQVGNELPCENVPYPCYPGQYSNVISVSGSQQNNTFVDGWNYGSFIDLNAPGRTDANTGLWSTDLNGTYTNDPFKTSGTSFSAPMVSGLVALIKSLNKTISPDQVKSILESTADKIDAQNHPYDNNGTGRNNYEGYGRINAKNALLETLNLMAGENKSISSQATAYNGRHKFYRESSGKLHEVFASGNIDGGEIFYRNSTDNGSTWNNTNRLSDGTMTSLAPCITMGPIRKNIKLGIV
jgi:Subtilase family